MHSWQQLGSTDSRSLRIAAIGHEVDLTNQSLMMSAALGAMGIDNQIFLLDVPKHEFEECVRHLQTIGFKGVTVSNPHKVDAARIAERFWIARFSLGVANALMFENGIFAQNTEVPGIIQCVKELEPTTALVMGTGHAARSVVAGLLQAGWKVKMWNRNANKTKVLYTLLSRHGDLCQAPAPDPSGCRLIVNATPLGLKPGEQPPLMWARVLPKTVCLDLVFRRVPTEFLRTGAMRGLKGIDGRELMVEQCALAMEWWTGQPVPRGPMKEAVGLKTPNWGSG